MFEKTFNKRYDEVFDYKNYEENTSLVALKRNEGENAMT